MEPGQETSVRLGFGANLSKAAAKPSLHLCSSDDVIVAKISPSSASSSIRVNKVAFFTKSARILERLKK